MVEKFGRAAELRGRAISTIYNSEEKKKKKIQTSSYHDEVIWRQICGLELAVPVEASHM